MSEYTILDYSPAHIPDMVDIWTGCFHDDASAAGEFIAALPDFGGAVVALQNGKTVGAAYALTGMELVGADSKRRPVLGYIYAVGVAENARHQGIGAALTQAAAELARRREAEIICVEPASPELFAWYEKLLNTKYVLRRRETEIESAPIEQVMPLSATEYMLWRRNLLAGKRYINHSFHSLEAQRRLLCAYGGGFYATESGIAAVGIEDERLIISELLCKDNSRVNPAAASLCAALGCKSALLREPDENGAPYMASDRPLPEGCVWNLTFD